MVRIDVFKARFTYLLSALTESILTQGTIGTVHDVERQSSEKKKQRRLKLIKEDGRQSKKIEEDWSQLKPIEEY